MTVQEPPAPSKATHYQVLMLDPEVDDEVLTEVYRRLVQRAHLADLDERRRVRVLRAIERAYAVLHDPVRRTLYDLELGGDPDASPPRVAVPVARPVPAPTSGPRVLDFGRYAGWTLRQVALRDRDYLEWLRRTPGGRQYQVEIASILTPR